LTTTREDLGSIWEGWGSKDKNSGRQTFCEEIRGDNGHIDITIQHFKGTKYIQERPLAVQLGMLEEETKMRKNGPVKGLEKHKNDAQ
jgi:hypothetical protein